GWFSRVIAERIAKLLDAGCQGVAPDRHPTPDAIEQFLLGDDLLRPLRQRAQHRCRPRGQPDFPFAAPDLSGSCVELKSAERETLIHDRAIPGNFPELHQYLGGSSPQNCRMQPRPRQSKAGRIMPRIMLKASLSLVTILAVVSLAHPALAQSDDDKLGKV